MAEEIELKLRVGAADLPRLTILLARLAEPGAPAAKRVYSVYYDTSDLRLLSAGVALRLRRVGRAWVQTLKGGGGVTGGLHRREERDQPVPGPAPEWALLEDGLPAGVRPEELRPVFTTDFRRLTFVIPWGRARVEAALDEGVIRCGEREEPLVELELERLSGRAVALYDLALALAEHVALAPEPRSKAERGYALFRGTGLMPVRAAAPALPGTATVEETFVRLLVACLDQIQRNQAGVIEGRDPEFVHQMRVGLRRLRALFSLFREAVPPASSAAFREEVVWLAHTLGNARDYDVLACEVLPAFTAACGPAPALERRVAERRREAGKTARTAAASPRYGRLMLGLGRWLVRQGWRRKANAAPLRGPARAFAAQLLAARHGKLLRRGRHPARLDAEARHRLRIRARKMRYGAESLASLFDEGRARRYVKALSRVQDALGLLNDLATATQRLPAVCGRSPRCLEEARRFELWAAARTREELSRLSRSWKRLRRCEPFWED